MEVFRSLISRRNLLAWKSWVYLYLQSYLEHNSIRGFNPKYMLPLPVNHNTSYALTILSTVSAYRIDSTTAADASVPISNITTIDKLRWALCSEDQELCQSVRMACSRPFANRANTSFVWPFVNSLPFVKVGKYKRLANGLEDNLFELIEDSDPRVRGYRIVIYSLWTSLSRKPLALRAMLMLMLIFMGEVFIIECYRNSSLATQSCNKTCKNSDWRIVVKKGVLSKPAPVADLSCRD